MTKKLLFIISSILLFLSSCGKDTGYRIDGKISNLEDQTVYVVFERDDTNIVDSVECEKPGQFSILQKQTGFHSATLFFEDKRVWITIYPVEGEKVTITGDINYPSLLEVKGGKTNNELTSVRKKAASLLREQADLKRLLAQDFDAEDAIDENELTARLANVNFQINEEILDYIRKHPAEEASVVLIQTFFADPDDTRRLDELLAMLDPDLRDFYLVKELEQSSARAKRTALGAEAPDFTVKNIYGETISLDSFPQKYVLLTFTAPWCDMCHTENLYLDEIAQKYPKEQLDLLLVSLDTNMGGVRDVLSNDSIQWNLVTDSAGQAAMLIDLYNVSSLPRSFLIDEEGKIILKTENGLEIKQTLEKLMEED